MDTRTCDLTVTRATVLPFDAGWSTLCDCDIVVHEGRIVALGEGVAARMDPQATLDGRNLLITPGLVNSHTHSPEALMRGLADGNALTNWLASVWAKLDGLDTGDISLAICLCAAEMLRGGVTSVVDHFRQTPLTGAAVDAAAGAWAASGMRSTLALMLRDQSLPPWLLERMPSAERQLALCEAAIMDWHGHDGRIQIAMGPSSPTRCSDGLLAQCAEIARAGNVKIHMHCDETAAEAALALKLYGMSAIQHLDRTGILGNDVSLAHAVFVDDADIDRLAAAGTTVVHNPISNLRLGSGLAPLARFLRQGVRVAVGSDGAASNDSQSVLEAMKLAVLLPRCDSSDARDWPSARDALRMVTEAPRAAFDMGPGTLEVGAEADFAAFDIRSPALLPANNLHCQFVFAGTSLQARHVVIAGKLILYDGEILSFDEPAIVAQARHYRPIPA